MKKIIYGFSLIAVLGLLFSSKAIQQINSPNEYKTKHVIILVLDGPRWSETFGDSTKQNVPYLNNELRPQGVFFNDFSNDGPTYTISGHTAMTTGIYQHMENSGKEIPKRPSIFQYYLKQYKADKRKAWVMTTKGKLNVLGYTKAKGWVREFYPSVYSGINGSGTGYPGDAKLFKIFQELITLNKPAVTIINLLEIDAWAHQGNWKNYIRAIKQNDKLAFELWDMIQKDEVMKDNTTLFITNDHGRHLDNVKDGFKSHGDRCAGCKKISLIAIGPDFKAGTEINQHHDLLDLNATAAELLHINMPTAKGNVIWELLGKKSENKDQK
ncbi:sulfatase [Putridiphycobacter roseus]|uniref:Sulfatase n=1 Tax=Putridiphycobacter roseus TaxID=2219161 RepID=A0A2W1NG12_9FLAO|nr:sulfatase-like hydrolase/transferase [Putridiphycobacter roseus]PZE18435.1 sulfatase [Putridiphycobacter roseus]